MRKIVELYDIKILDSYELRFNAVEYLDDCFRIMIEEPTRAHAEYIDMCMDIFCALGLMSINVYDKYLDILDSFECEN